MKKYKSDIIFFSLLTAFIISSYLLADIVLPFIVALGLAFTVNPFIKRIQKIVPNRNTATSLFLVTIIGVFVLIIWIFAQQISNDFKRLNSAFHTYAESNHEMFDETAQSIKSFIDKIYSPEMLKEQLGIDTASSDTLSFNELINEVDKNKVFKELDTDAIKESLVSLTSLFKSNDEETNQTENDSSGGLNWFIIFVSSLGYFIYIIYTLDYFEKRFQKYLGRMRKGILHNVFQDIRSTFLSYFKQRSKIVFIYTLIYITAFYIIGLPGALILGIVAGILCFISYFQYITLIPIALGCLILSIEQEHGFLFYFGITLGVFVFSSLLEEFFLYDKIMKDVKGMNPAIMMVSVAIWGYLLGTFGILIALPLTSIIQSYIKQLLIQANNESILK